MIKLSSMTMENAQLAHPLVLTAQTQLFVLVASEALELTHSRANVMIPTLMSMEHAQLAHPLV